MARIEGGTLTDQLEWYFGFHERWPDTFPLPLLSRNLGWVIENEQEEDYFSELPHYLRASLLTCLYKAINQCQQCPLHTNRPLNRAIIDDGCFSNNHFQANGSEVYPVGACAAEIMIVGSSPGEYEQRTGQPYVGIQTLLGSVCARECAGFETCYPPGSNVPQEECWPSSLRKAYPQFVQIQENRADQNGWNILTEGALLDRLLYNASLWRESWNSRRLYRSRKEGTSPGTVYICYTTKCRSYEEPTQEDTRTCFPWLEMQFAIVQPKVTVCLGANATQSVLGISDPKIPSLRGQVFNSRFGPVIVETDLKSMSGKPEILRSMVDSFHQAKAIAAGDTVEIHDIIKPAYAPVAPTYTPTFPKS